MCVNKKFGRMESANSDKSERTQSASGSARPAHLWTVRYMSRCLVCINQDRLIASKPAINAPEAGSRHSDALIRESSVPVSYSNQHIAPTLAQ